MSGALDFNELNTLRWRGQYVMPVLSLLNGEYWLHLVTVAKIQLSKEVVMLNY